MRSKEREHARGVDAVTALAERRFVCLALGTQDLEFGVAVAAMIFINRHDANLTGKLDFSVTTLATRDASFRSPLPLKAEIPRLLSVATKKLDCLWQESALWARNEILRCAQNDRFGGSFLLTE